MVAMRMEQQKQRFARASLEAMCLLSGCIRDASACLSELRQRQAPLSATRLAEYIHAQMICMDKVEPGEVAELDHERPHAELQNEQSIPSRSQQTWSCLPDECVTAIIQHLEGDELVMMSAACTRLRRLSTENSLWIELCSKLHGFCEDKTIETSTPRGKWTEWVRLYRALSRDCFCRAMSSDVVLPQGSSMATEGMLLRYSGEIGSDRAARAKEGWILPSAVDTDNAISRLGLLAKANFWGCDGKGVEWDVPPLLVSCEPSGRRARYIYSKCRYFEVKILPCCEPDAPPAEGAVALERWCIAVGVSTLAFSLEGMQPGWDLNSCAYHGDDGRVFFGNSCVSSLPKFGPADTVGCGLSCDGSLFFTKNGTFLGFVRDVTQHLCNGRGSSRMLYPTVGVDSLCPIEINWGRMPFMYAFEELRENGNVGGLSAAGRRVGAGWQYDRFSQMLEDDGCQCSIM